MTANNQFEAMFTQEQVYKIEAKYNETHGVSKRLMMMTLTKSHDELFKMVTDMLEDDSKSDAYFDLIAQIDEYKKHLEAGVEIAQAALARLMLVGDEITGITFDNEDPAPET